MGERRARWGYGYQDKVATERILRILKDDLRGGSAVFEGVRLADLQAGRVDDFVLVWKNRVEGNSIIELHQSWFTLSPACLKNPRMRSGRRRR